MRKGAHALRRERVCVPDLCRMPQNGNTPLHLAVNKGHAAVVEILLKMEVATDKTNKVTEEGG